jgi:hypothetical protein
VNEMGQYHKLYNLDKKEFVNPHNIGNGLKLIEQVAHEKSTSTALFFLVANSNGRGGGDAQEHPAIGRWAGDRIVVQGDFADEFDPAYINNQEREGFTDISSIVKEMLDVGMSNF